MKSKRTQHNAQTTILHADNGVIIGRMNDLQKQFSDMRNAIDLSEKSNAFIRAGMAGLAAQAVNQYGVEPAAIIRENEFMGTGRNFAPGTPVLPVNPDREPRQFAYTPGTNYTWIPRAGYGILDFYTLRELAFASKEIRLNVEMVKRTLRGLKHEVVQDTKIVDTPGGRYKATPADAAEKLSFWKKPDGYYDFDSWLDMIMEDALVCGATTIFLPPAGKPQAQQTDVTTWRILTDYDGRIPAHPNPAFLQVTYGRPNFWSSRKHLLHAPIHPTINNPYGYTATEFIVQSVVQSIRRDSARTGAFTDGNVPYAFVGLPTAWTPKQIQDFTEWFNGVLQGDVNRANKLMFIPHDGTSLPVAPFSGVDQNQTGLDEWLLKVAAWAFGNNPAEFGLTSGGGGLGGKGFMDAGENAQYRGSIAVYTQWVSGLINQINSDYLDAPWAKSRWVGIQPPEDELKKAQLEDARIKSGVWSVDYVQDQIGYPREKYPVKPPAPAPAPMGMPGAMPAPGATPAASAFAPTRPPVPLPPNFGKLAERAVIAELLDWRDRERRRVEKGITLAAFRPECIPAELAGSIRASMLKADTRTAVDAVFSAAIGEAKTPEKLQKMMGMQPGPGNSEIDDLLTKIGA